MQANECVNTARVACSTRHGFAVCSRVTHGVEAVDKDLELTRNVSCFENGALQLESSALSCVKMKSDSAPILAVRLFLRAR